MSHHIVFDYDTDPPLPTSCSCGYIPREPDWFGDHISAHIYNAGKADALAIVEQLIRDLPDARAHH